MYPTNSSQPSQWWQGDAGDIRLDSSAYWNTWEKCIWLHFAYAEHTIEVQQEKKNVESERQQCIANFVGATRNTIKHIPTTMQRCQVLTDRIRMEHRLKKIQEAVTSRSQFAIRISHFAYIIFSFYSFCFRNWITGAASTHLNANSKQSTRFDHGTAAKNVFESCYINYWIGITALAFLIF